MASPSTFPVSPLALARTGIAFDALCAQAGVVPAPSLGTEDFFRLWTTAEELLDDRSAGLRFGERAVAEGFSHAAIVATHAPDLRRALLALARYKRLTCPEVVDVEAAGTEIRVRYRWLHAKERVPRLLVDTTMASLAAMIRQGSEGRVAPIRIELARPAADAALLQQHFGCTVTFGAMVDAMILPIDVLYAPFVGADEHAFTRIIDGLERQLVESRDADALVDDLRVTIARQLSEGRRTSLAHVATRMGMSARTLQRRLIACGTSFQAQLDQVRRITASRLLVNTDLDPIAIAMLVGFVEPNSFARAFRAWERTTPLRWRARHGAGFR
ncbi:MAG: HTH-type transcriptional regulator VirS [Luteibacter sp.]|uniref:AraC family transcriptional regulator n=1 Tax=Luteibacter sp. TaxID=1886636 RepID=UPI00137DFD1C|nr:AraC family transcriptional regulator [Luteibacter sp.]KAF1004525.1 MAG: HTH-type transcriptional regulator VirS [Luteibacter sp.]